MRTATHAQSPLVVVTRWTAPRFGGRRGRVGAARVRCGTMDPYRHRGRPWGVALCACTRSRLQLVPYMYVAVIWMLGSADDVSHASPPLRPYGSSSVLRNGSKTYDSPESISTLQSRTGVPPLPGQACAAAGPGAAHRFYAAAWADTCECTDPDFPPQSNGSFCTWWVPTTPCAQHPACGTKPHDSVCRVFDNLLPMPQLLGVGISGVAPHSISSLLPFALADHVW